MARDLPLLAFFTNARSGPARRMESLLSHLVQKQRGRLRLTQVDVDHRPELARRFRVAEIPTLLLIKDRRVVARLEGRASAPRIEDMLDTHIDGTPGQT